MRALTGYFWAGLLVTALAAGCSKTPPTQPPASPGQPAAGDVGVKPRKPSATERIKVPPPPP